MRKNLPKQTYKVARPRIFVGTPSIFESLRLKLIYLYCKTIVTHVLHEGFVEHWSIVARKSFKENLSTNFGLIAVFVKVAFEITKRAQHCVLPHLHVFVFFEIAQVYLRLTGCKVYEGHLQNDWVIKTFWKHPKSSKFVFISFIFYALFLEIQRYPKIPRTDFWETSHDRRLAPKV